MRYKSRAGFLLIIIAVVLCSIPIVTSPAEALDINLSEYYQFEYLVSFSDKEVQENEVFYLDISGQVTCIKDMPFGADNAQIAVKFIARHMETGDTKVLNASYTIIVTPFPDWAGDTYQFNKHIDLMFPTGSQQGEYDIIGQIVHVDIDGWDVTDLIPEAYKSRNIGTVTCVDNILVPPTVSTSAATSVEETTASGHGVITSTGGEDCDYRGFAWGTTSHSDPGNIVPASSGYDSNWTENGSYGTGIFNHDITSLTEGTKYYFRACAHNSAGWSYGIEQSFLSKPEPPASFSATNFDTTRIDLSWTKGAGAWKTKIQRKVGSYPVDRTDGTQIYFDTGIAKSDTGLTPNTAYYYRAWSYVDGSEQWSDTYAQASAGTFSGYAIDLVSDWNLVSLPLIPDNTDIDAVINAGNLASGNLANIVMVYTFNTTAETWMWWNGSPASTLNTMEDGRGYWFYTTAADTLTVHGTEAGHPGPDYPVLTGWDMIGFTSTSDMAPESYLASVSGKYTMLYRCAAGGWLWWTNGNPASTFTNMEPTYGYWLFMTANGTITPP